MRSLAAIILFISGLVATQSGCKENTIINSRVSPSNNQVNVYSVSLPCITHTYFDDTTVTSTNIGGIQIYQAVGSITDPFFGTMTGATFFQLIPSDFSPTLYTNETVDSAILVLPYSGFTYGDTANQSLTQTYQVFYMSDSMSFNTYLSSSTKPIDALNPLSAPTTVNTYHLKDSLGLNILPNNYPGLRIGLKIPALMSHLGVAQTSLTNTSTNPVGDFIANFNGICVRVADTRQSGTAMPYFQLDGADVYSEASILVYHHTTGTTTTADSFSAYYFSTNNNCGHFNNITRNYSQYPVNNLIHSTAANDQIIALQNQPGPCIDVVIPGIKSLPAGVINKAELQFTLLPGTYNVSPFFAPERLYPVGIASATYPDPIDIGAGVPYNIADRYPLTSLTPLAVMDGYIHSFTRDGIATPVSTFTIDIPREVMSSIAAKNDTIHLHISGTQDFYGAFHMVAGGGKYGVDGTTDTVYRPKLFVVYSKLSQ